MSNQLAVVSQNSNQVQFSEDQVSVIKNQIAVGATDLELKSFIWQCQRTGLDPFARQIYFIKSNGKVQIQTSIDGFRLIAERSGLYEGQTRPRWCGKDGVFKEIWTSTEFPFACEVGVYKKGQREPTYGLAKWDEYAGQTPQFMWKKMPAHMLAKVAESLALRKAFPNEMSGLYTQEEMAQANGPYPEDGGAYGNGGRVVPEQPPADEGDPNGSWGYIIPFGKFQKRTLDEVAIPDLKNYVNWLETNAKKKNQPLGPVQLDFIDRACAHIAAIENKPFDSQDERDIPL